MLTEELLGSIDTIRLPLKRSEATPCDGLLVSRLLREQTDVPATVTRFRCNKDSIHRLKATLEEGRSIVIETKAVANDYDASIVEVWRCTSVFLEGSVLCMESPQDRKLDTTSVLEGDVRTEVLDAWASGLKYIKEVQNGEGEIIQKGFREPQYAALHALATHWASSSSPATVVLPTGTGKTDVMIGAIVANGCDRTLVIVPTDALRNQTVEKFQRYGILPVIAAIASDLPLPVMGCVNGAPDIAMVEALSQCNIVVTTMASISKAGDDVQRRFASVFSHVFFDEAHHKEAGTWKKFHAFCDASKVLLMTATPFRQDGKPIGGNFIYNFPLHKAQEQGYFKKIRFCEVFEPDESLSDRAIAETAVGCLRRELNEGKNHLMMARASSITEAKRLFDEIYEPLCPDLNPVVIHSRSANESSIQNDIKAFKHKVIICVDMLGEGFDLPELKIAALHAVHKSIGVTLQFIGRFTRLTEGVGDATFVANLAEDGVPESLEELYQEDADWNLVVSELSYDAISPQAKLAGLVSELEEVYSEEGVSITPLTLKPKISSQVYRTTAFYPERYDKAFGGKVRIVQVWKSQNNDFLAVVTHIAEEVEWSDTRDVKIDTWDLHLVYHDVTNGLLYVNSSRKNGMTKKQVGKIAANPTIIDGEDVFRSFSGLHRLTLHNVGLTGRSKNVRYQMFAGIDVRNAITPIIEGDKLKSNVAGVGYEEGRRANVGCSRKGKVWSMTSGSLAEWKDWCDHVGSKLINTEIQPRDFLKNTLIPENIGSFDSLGDAFGIMVDWPDQLFQSQVFSFELEVGRERYSHHDCELKLDSWNVNESCCGFSILAYNEPKVSLSLKVSLDGANATKFEVNQMSEAEAKVVSSGEFAAAEFFEENPPLIRLSDGSQLSGDILLKPKEQLGDTFDRTLIQTIDWSQADLGKESRWKDDTIRPDSIQQVFIEHLLNDDTLSHIIDDDDSGESADVVAIKENDDEVIVYLWHCKFSSDDNPGNRVKDLYEVCGQAQKSSKWTWSFDRLVKHIKKRDTESLGGRDTRFVKGDYQSLHTLRKSARRKQISYRVGIVQPGLAKSTMPEDHLSLLGATNAFISCITNHSLLVYASD